MRGQVRIRVFHASVWGLFQEDARAMLAELFPDVEFEHVALRAPNEALREAGRGGADAYVVFVLSSIPGIVRPILMSGVPTLVVNETYTGSGEFLLEYSRALRAGKPVLAVSTRSPADRQVLKRYVGYLVAIGRLKRSKILLIAGDSTVAQASLEFPLSVDMYSTIRDVQTIFGVQVDVMPITDFRRRFYDVVGEGEAARLAEKWAEEAPKLVDHTPDQLRSAARLYLALKAAVSQTGADAVAFNCIPLFVSGAIDAWPCVPFMRLQEEGVIGACEGDLYSAALMLMMKYLANKPGYINDPAIDDVKGEVVYYHCYSPVNMYGFSDPRRLNYAIVPSHSNTKTQSVWVEYPPGEMATVLGLSPAERLITVHQAEITGNEYGPHVCATKVVARLPSTRALAEHWPERTGWHRVLFLGDLREDVANMARLLGLRVVEPA